MKEKLTRIEIEQLRYLVQNEINYLEDSDEDYEDLENYKTLLEKLELM